MNDCGKYSLSKHKSSKAQRFATSPREDPVLKHQLKTPSPYN